SAYVIVLSLAALPLGVIGDLRSRRAVIAFGVGLWSAFTALGATVTRFWQLLVCRSLVGVGEAGYGPAAQALIAEVYQGRRRALVGAVLSGLLDLFAGLPPGIETAVFAACVSAGIVWTVVRLVPAAVRRTTEATEVAATAFGEFLQAAATVLRTPTLIWMFLG